jgi:uncharacterized protein (TIGR00299 family) protein
MVKSGEQDRRSQNMKIAYLDCRAGISGNMFLGALLSYGLPQKYLFAELDKLKVVLPTINVKRIKQQQIEATLFEVSDCEGHHHRNLDDIELIINSSSLETSVKVQAIKCFQNLAAAEAKIHGIAVETVHFHEVGALDAIIDIVGAAIGINYFNFDRILVSPVRMGCGSIHCAHGEIPLPGPAALELMKGFTIFSGELAGEWTTPTGAAILKTFTQPVASIPSLQLIGVGYGAGSTERKIPNILRLIVGEAQQAYSLKEQQIVMETNIDDMNPEMLGYLGKKLLSCGVKDYFYTPIYMKKNRPALKLTIIFDPNLTDKVERILFNETTTLGVRKYFVERSCMERGELMIDFDNDSVRIKTGLIAGKVVKYAPEYEDCQAIAIRSGKSLQSIYETALLKARQILKKED